jgi:hypothetical protein
MPSDKPETSEDEWVVAQDSDDDLPYPPAPPAPRGPQDCNLAWYIALAAVAIYVALGIKRSST